jgi:hypothetical protein
MCACSSPHCHLLHMRIDLKMAGRALFFRSTIAASVVPEQVRPWTYSDYKVLWTHSLQAYSQPHTRNVHKLAWSISQSSAEGCVFDAYCLA